MEAPKNLSSVHPAEKAFAKAKEGLRKIPIPSLSTRQQRLHRLLEVVRKNEKKWVEALHADLGKPLFETLSSEIQPVEKEILRQLKYLPKWMKRKKVSSPWWTVSHLGARAWLQPEPKGTVLILSPWNYPIHLSLIPLAGAIAAGNSVFLKPSELAPAASRALAEILNSEFAEDEVRVIEGGAEAAEQLASFGFDHIFFTGSTRVGKLVMKAAAEHLSDITLELGGKSPVFIAPGTDLRKALKKILWGKFWNAGQTCVAPDYVWVEKSQLDSAIQESKVILQEFFGPEPQLSPDYARIVNRTHTERLEKLLDGQKVVVGGKVDKEHRFIAPTLVTTTDWNSPLLKEEIFGPILPLLAYESWEDAIQESARRFSPPLVAYLFSSDSQKRRDLLTHLRSGALVENDVVIHLTHPELPFGGRRESGIGQYHGKFSFESFSFWRSIEVKPLFWDLPFRYAPFAKNLKFLKGLWKSFT